MKCKKFFKSIYFFLLLSLTPISSFLFCKENCREELIEKCTPSIPFSNTPLWVEPVDYDSENYEDNVSFPGVAYLLINRQFNIEDKIHYIRRVCKIVSKTALADISQISMPLFNSQQAELVVHDLKIIRDGTVIDKLATTKKKIFYPSSGSTEVFFYLDNLRIGDIIDVSYSFRLKTEELLGDIWNLKESAIYKKMAYSCLVGENKTLIWKTYGFEQEPIYSVNTPYKKYSWEFNDYKTHFLPENDSPSSPSGRDPFINISTASWNDIAKRSVLRQFNKIHFSDPPQNVVQLIQEWKSIYPTVEEQILAAIRLVSDDVYYASIPDDEEEHSITPYTPEKTLENHYGDCKDKSALLVAILKLLNVEAYPVLVHGEKTYELKEELPNYSFNHVIVKIEYNGKSYFVDPTETLLGGTLDTYQVSDFGYGLVIKEDTEDLIPITRKFLSKKKSICTISIEGANGTWNYEGQFFHKIANRIRKKLVPGYVNKESKGNLADLQDVFPNAEIVYTSPLQIQDDRQANIITKNFALSLKNVGQKTPTGTFYDLTTLVRYLALSIKDIDLSKDYYLEKSLCCFDEEVSRVVDIYCDKPPRVEEKKISYRDENMSYSFTLEKLSDTHIRVIFYQKFFTTYIEAAQLPQFIKKLEEFKNHLSIKIEIPD